MTALLSQTWFIALMSVTLIGAVLAAVHHAEVIAHKTGEPYGTLVLSISVTIIEVSLIISMMLTGHEGSQFIARDAVFATVMIVVNGVIGLCIFTISACKKKENSSNDFIQEAGRTAPNNTNQPHPVTNAVKIWKDFNLSDIDKLDDSISGIEVRIKVRNQLAVQTDIGSFATSARLESSIAKGIGKLLKSQPNSAISARLLLKQIAVSPLSAETLAYAFSIELNDKQKKAISVSRSRYEAFSTLFAAMSGEPSVEIQNQILSSGTDDWITSGKWPFMNLNFIIEARVQLAAAEVLIQYVEKGGDRKSVV